MIGMNHITGRAIDGLQHLYQSIAKILTTPIGSRIGRRDFGSELHNLIDAPNNPATRVRVFAATATALMRWEPRLKVTRIGLVMDTAAPGSLVIEIEGTTNISRDRVSTAVPINLAKSVQ
jgi:phage baseplate assembly protein W